MHKKLMPLFAAVGLLLWAGCSDVLAPSPRNETGLRITISNGTAGARTLYPNADFSKYILHFEGPGTHADITLTAGQNSTTVSGLAAGTWTITATGYVMINGTEYPAAEGSEQVTVTAGSFQGIGITIKASQNGADGFFSYSVSFPSSRVNDAELRIYPFGGNEGAWGTQVFDLRETSSDSLSLAPGYYVMSIRLSTGYQTAARREIVHIYSNMETCAAYTFTDEDFTDTVTLSGTANVTVNGEVPSGISGIRVTAYLNNDWIGYPIGSGQIKNDKTWSMRIAAFDADTPVYFAVEGSTQNNNSGTEFFRGTGIHVPVKDEDISGIAITLDIGLITLSGTANVTMDGQVPVYFVVVALLNDDSALGWVSQNVENDNTWSMQIPAFDAATPVYFQVDTGAVIYGSGWEQIFKETDLCVTVKDEDISDIAITCNISYITLSGTVDVSMYGQDPDEVRIYPDHHIYTSINPQTLRYASANKGDNGWSWSMRIPSFDENTPLCFQVRAYLGGWEESKWIDQSVTVNDHDVNNINLGRVDFTVDIDIANAIPLTEDIWVDGNITTSNPENWYSISVTAGTTYYISWDDWWYMDGTKTLNGNFDAYYSNGYSIFSFVPVSPGTGYRYASFTATRSGTVYLRARSANNRGTGTYAVMYSTNSHWNNNSETALFAVYFGPEGEMGNLLSEIAVITANGVSIPAATYNSVPVGTVVTINITLPTTGTGSDYFLRAAKISLNGGEAFDFPPSSGGTTGPWTWTYYTSTIDAVISIDFRQPPPPPPDWLEAGAKLVYSNGVLLAGSAQYTHWCIGVDPFFTEWNIDYNEIGNFDVVPGVDLMFADPVNDRMVMRLAPSHLTWSWCSAVFFLEEVGAVAPFVNNIAANAYNLVFEHMGGAIDLTVYGVNTTLVADGGSPPNQPASPNAWATRTISLGNSQDRVRQVIFSAIGENEPIYIDRIRFVPKE